MTVAERPDLEQPVGLREAVRVGGVRTVAILGGVAAVDDIDNAVIQIFAPEIKDSLGLSITGLAVIGSTAGAVFVAGAIPIARLADRSKRNRIVAVATLAWSLAAAAIGVVRNTWQFVLARTVGGLAKANVLPVHNSMLADAYP
jgi:MFS family permease